MSELPQLKLLSGLKCPEMVTLGEVDLYPWGATRSQVCPVPGDDQGKQTFDSSALSLRSCP